MELSAFHAALLVSGLAAVFLAFLVAYVARPISALAFIAVLIPFQFIDTRYGTGNIGMVYLAFTALFLRHMLDRFPLLPLVGFVLSAYAFSIITAPRGTWVEHGFYVVGIISNFLLFYIAYNIFLRFQDLRFALRILIVINILCVLYSLLLFFSGYQQSFLVGDGYFSLRENLEDRRRLMGPFTAAEINSAFFATQIFFLLYAGIFTERGWGRWVCYLQIPLSLVFIVASGSRGSFVALVAGLILFFFLLRHALGARRILRFSVIGLFFVAISGLYVATQTGYESVFYRLANTEISESGVPDTRQKGFSLTMERLESGSILFGNGPRLRLIDEHERRIAGYEPLGFYPHNLALFLVYSIGIVGLLSYVIFFSALFFLIFRAQKNRSDDKALRYLPSLGVVFMVTFFLDQLTIEFLRVILSDYQHYIFFVLGMLLAFSRLAQRQGDRKRMRHRGAQGTFSGASFQNANSPLWIQVHRSLIGSDLHGSV